MQPWYEISEARHLISSCAARLPKIERHVQHYALTIIAAYVNATMSEYERAGDMILDGIEMCRKEMAEEDAAGWREAFASDGRAYRAMQAGVGA